MLIVVIIVKCGVFMIYRQFQVDPKKSGTSTLEPLQTIISG